MQFELRKTSDWKFRSKVEINSIDELMKFIKENGSVIVDLRDKTTKDEEGKYHIDFASIPTIEIYDDWRE